jgi:hypothetical protein
MALVETNSIVVVSQPNLVALWAQIAATFATLITAITAVYVALARLIREGMLVGHK